MNRRWSCPNGLHPGVLAPSRLRKIDVRRYCLECSTAEGVLVERSCKANEQAAERTRARSAKKAATKRAARSRAKAAVMERQRRREIVDGIDIARELDRLWAYALQLAGPLLYSRKVPRLTVSLSEKTGTSGRAWSSGRVHLTVGKGCDRYRLCGVLAHEVAHQMSWGEGHGPGFWSTLAELVLEAYGTDPS